MELFPTLVHGMTVVFAVASIGIATTTYYRLRRLRSELSERITRQKADVALRMALNAARMNAILQNVERIDVGGRVPITRVYETGRENPVLQIATSNEIVMSQMKAKVRASTTATARDLMIHG